MSLAKAKKTTHLGCFLLEKSFDLVCDLRKGFFNEVSTILKKEYMRGWHCIVDNGYHIDFSRFPPHTRHRSQQGKEGYMTTDVRAAQASMPSPKVGVGVYIFKDGKLLVGRRRGSHGAGEYATPGGGLEYMESIESCAIRETFEETGLRIKNIRFLRVINLTRYAPKHFIDISVVADWAEGEPQVREPDKIEAWEWRSLDDLPRPLFGMMSFTLEALRSGRCFWDSPETSLLVEETSSRPLTIYFSSAVQGGANFAEMRARIDFLETMGEVTTRHMRSAATVDLGLKDSREIYAHDQQLLAKSDVLIADLSQPSTGAGFMIARAVARGLPVLCLFAEGKTPSAMIEGCPEITTRFFDGTTADFQQKVRAFLLENAHRFVSRTFPKARKVFIAGPPGAGKGTVAKRLAAETGLIHVSSGDLLRELVKTADHPHGGLISRCMADGINVPAYIMVDLVIERLRRPDCRMFGFILDGYPPSRGDLQNLIEAGIRPDVLFFLDCTDVVAVKRQVGRHERSTDTEEKATKRVRNFHNEGADYRRLVKEWYPNDLVVRVDADLQPDTVFAFVKDTLSDLFGPAEREGSFSLMAPFRVQDQPSTRLHFHIDAVDAATLRRIAHNIYRADKSAQGRMRLYPIQALHLGPQISLMPELYGCMANFHPIDNADDEAFITGRLNPDEGDLFDKVIMAGLAGHMVELEEYLAEWVIDSNGKIISETVYDEPLSLRALRLEQFDRVQRVPKDRTLYELHLGFDLPKISTSGVMPIDLALLTDACTAGGSQNGGWFLFKNRATWAYRSNEFFFGSERDAVIRLNLEAKRLRELLKGWGFLLSVSFSLELVHGIWVPPTIVESGSDDR